MTHPIRFLGNRGYTAREGILLALQYEPVNPPRAMAPITFDLNAKCVAFFLLFLPNGCVTEKEALNLPPVCNRPLYNANSLICGSLRNERNKPGTY